MSTITILGTSDHSYLVSPSVAAARSGAVVEFDGVSGVKAAEEATVATPHPAWVGMRRRWALIDALMGGTLAMRAWREDFLPKERGEEDAAYEERLRRTYLFNGLKDAVGNIVSKPFSRDVSLKAAEGEEIDERVERWQGDANGKGASLTGILSHVFWEAMKYGFCHALTDMPRAPEGQPTAADDAARLPRTVVIPPPDLFNWEFGDDGHLNRVHIREVVSERAGQWGTKFVTRIRVLWRDRFELWRPAGRAQGRMAFELVDEGVMIGADGRPTERIPLRTFYVAGAKVEEMIAEPPLQDLAELNLDHWQTYSDYANTVHFIGVPLLFAKGFNKKEEKGAKVASVTSVIVTENDAADLKYVEHSGKATEAQRAKLQDLEEAMRARGMDPLMPNRPGDVKATEVAVASTKSHSAVQRWVTDEQQFALGVLTDVHGWLGIAPKDMPEELTVDIFQDFSVAGERQDVAVLSNMAERGQLSLHTLLAEVRRRGVISESIDVAEELARIEAEEPEPAPQPQPAVDPAAQGAGAGAA